MAPYQEPGLNLAGATYLGSANLASAADPAGTVPLLVSLDFSNASQLNGLLAELSNPLSPEYHQYLTHAEFDSEFGGNAAVYGSLVGYFDSFGVTQLTTHPDRLTITFQATSSQLASIFHTELGSYLSPSGQPYFAPLATPELPSLVAPYVTGVEGLSNYSEYLNHADSEAVTQQLISSVGTTLTGPASLPGSPTSTQSPVSQGSGSNPFTPTTVGGRTYDEPVTLTSSTSCDTTTCGNFIEGPDLQVTYNETGLFAKYGYPVGVTVAALLWTDLINKGSTGSDGNSFCNSQTSGTYSWDFFMPDVTSYWNYTLPSGEPMPHAISLPQTGSGTYDYPANSPGNQGYSASCNVDGDEAENTLDVAMEGALAPGANVFQVFGQGATTASITTGMADIISPTTAEFSMTGGFDTTANIAALSNVSVIANSWTTGSTATLGTTWNNYLKEAQTLGITVVASSGDSANNAVDPPASEASNAYGAVSVGGTTVVVNPTTLLRTADHLASMASPYYGVGGGEIVWYEPAGTTDGFGSTYGTVGGVATSANNYAPMWQNNSADAHGVITGIKSSGYGRGEPDISAIANDTLLSLDEGVYSLNLTCIVSSGCTKVSSNSVGTTVGYTYFIGTSISDQVAGGVIATIDYDLSTVHQGRLGFLDPTLYPVGQLQYAGELALHSVKTITTYHNSESASTYGAFAAGGWNADDGWGAIDAGNYTQNSLTYNLTFTESGLSSGTSWSVTVTPMLGDANCTVSGSACSISLQRTATFTSGTSSLIWPEVYGTYTYTVQAVSGYTSSPSSGTLTVNGANVNQGIAFTPGVNPPSGAPTLLSATAVSAAGIDLGWTNPSGALLDNAVYWGTSCGSLTKIDLGVVTTSYDKTGLSPSTSYCFTVSASTSGGEGPQSTSASTTTLAATTPAITVTPGQGPVGATVTVSGTSFPASTALTSLAFDSKTISSCTSGSLTTGATGAFSCTFKVPSGTSGTTVKATGTGGSTASGTFAVTTPAITVSPTSGPIGAVVTVSGTGFSVSMALTSLVFDTKTISSCTSGSLTTSGTGAFSCAFKVPSGTSGTTVKATDVGGQTATGKFMVTTPAITLSPTTGPVGATVKVSGTGFSVSAALTSLVFDSETISTCTSGSLASGSTGAFSCTFKVPSGTSGTTVKATDEGGQSASGTFKVTTPAITVSPTSGAVGASVKVSGTGFSVSTALASLVFDSKGITTCTSGSLTTGSTGTFSCTFKVPSGTSGTIVRATDLGGQTASATYTVTTPATGVIPMQGPLGMTRLGSVVASVNGGERTTSRTFMVLPPTN
ncbi:MAG: protease pro-enzyme activation domain-containing protein [Thermoplasmata archaeon]